MAGVTLDDITTRAAERAARNADLPPVEVEEAMAVALRVVGVTEILGIARAADDQAALRVLRACQACGGASPDVWWTKESRGIEVRRDYGAPATLVTWTGILALVRAGITADRIARLQVAFEGYCRLATSPHDFSRRSQDQAVEDACQAFYEQYGVWTRAMQVVEDEVLSAYRDVPRTDQLALFS